MVLEKIAKDAVHRTLTPHQTSDEILKLPAKIFYTNDKLIVVEAPSVKSEVLKVFSLPELTFLYGWGEVPSESIPSTLDTHTIECNEVGFETYTQDHKIMSYSVEDGSINLDSIIPMPVPWSPVNRIRKINDSIYFVDNPTHDNHLKFEHVGINRNNNEIFIRFGEYPNLDPNMNEGELVNTYVKNNISRPRLKNRFVAHYVYYSRFKIYDNNGSLIKDISLNEETRVNHNRIIRFGNGFGTKNYFFLLIFDLEPNQIYGENGIRFKPVLTIWDWDGSPIGRCILDQPIVDFCVLESEDKIIGITQQEPKIFEFDLRKLNLTPTPME